VHASTVLARFQSVHEWVLLLQGREQAVEWDADNSVLTTHFDQQFLHVFDLELEKVKIILDVIFPHIKVKIQMIPVHDLTSEYLSPKFVRLDASSTNGVE
jgi:hypothetical protein